jgi:hypothetical protein
MGLPTLEKTWQFNVNQYTAASTIALTDAQAWVFKLKQSLTGFASSPWTVIRSSNSSTSGASDLWISPANLSWNSGGGARSWIVLQQTGVTGGNLQICLELLSSSSPDSLAIAFSPNAGFTGGTTSARPTATDEFSFGSVTITPTTSFSSVLHVMQSTDGQSTRAFLMIGGVVKMALFIETVADSPASLTFKGLVSFLPNLSSDQHYSSSLWKGRFGAVNFVAYTGTEVYNNTRATAANSGALSSFTSQYVFSPISAHSETVNAKGRVGRLVDLWFGPYVPITGSTFPASPDDKEFLQLFPFTVPWNGTTPILF